MNSTQQIIVFITGANQGIGFETAKILLIHSPNYHVLLGSRDPIKGSEAAATLTTLPNIKGTVTPIQIDVTDDTSVDASSKLVEEKYGRIDILLNNAGIYDPRPHARDALRATLAVNLVGAVSVTETFLPLLRRSSSPRLIFVSSSLGSISQAADPTSRYYSPLASWYRCSKAAVNMLIVQYWAGLRGEGFKVFGADPGLTATNFMDPSIARKRGGVEPEVGAERVAAVVRGDRDGDVGRVCGAYGVSPW